MSERMGKYWICDECADRRGYECFKTGNTRAMGLCSWCNRDDETFLTPMRDLKTAGGLRADMAAAGSGEDL